MMISICNNKNPSMTDKDYDYQHTMHDAMNTLPTLSISMVGGKKGSVVMFYHITNRWYHL